MAAKYGNISLAEELIASGVDINPHHSLMVTTPLYAASINGRLKMVEFLLGKKADVNLISRGNVHGTPLSAAIASGMLKIVDKLIEHGADVHHHNNFTKDTLLHTAILFLDNQLDDRIAIVKRLVELKVDIHARDLFNETPLECAASKIETWTVQHGEAAALTCFSMLESLLKSPKKVETPNKSTAAVVAKNSPIFTSPKDEIEDDFVFISNERTEVTEEKPKTCLMM